MLFIFYNKKKLNPIRSYHFSCIRLLVFGWIGFSASLLFAQQTPLETYIEVLSDFENIRPIVFKTDYTFYKIGEKEKPYDKMSIEVWKTKEKTYIRMEEQEIYLEGSQMIYVDHLERSIYLLENEANTLLGMDLKVFSQWVEALQLTGVHNNTEDGLGLIHFTASNESKMEIELKYDTLNQLPKEIMIVIDLSTLDGVEYEYDQTRMKASFSNYQLENVQLPIKRSQIIKGTGKNIVAQEKYRDYKIEQS